MTAFELLEAARERHIELTAREGRLFHRGPEGALTPELRAAIREEKPALLAVLDPSVRFVTLKGGLIVPAAALVLAIDLEMREIPLAVDGEGEFIIPVTPKLLPADDAAIRRWRRHLAAIVAYRVPDEEQPQ